MAFFGHTEAVVTSSTQADDVVFSHVGYVLHVVPIPLVIFDKSNRSLGLDLGYSCEYLLVSAVKLLRGS